MDPELVAQTLNFHGQQLTKIWETDRGAASLQANSLRDLDYQVYQKRSKDLGFQERGKRMRMHQFIVEKAPQLFNKAEKQTKDGVVWAFKSKDEDFVPMIPPLETFCRFDKIDSRANFFQSLRVGDVLMCQVQQKTFQGLVIRVIATDIGTRVRDVRELGIKGSIHPDHTISSTDRKDGQYNAGDLVRCEVIDLNADNEKLACGVKGIHHQGGEIQFGLVTKDQLPKSYRAMMEADGKSYEECLQSNRTFVNPSAVEHMARSFGLNTACTVSNSLLKGLNAPIPEKDNADELRKIQNGKWALKSVAEGIKYFKAGQETEAFQCLNKALHIDPLNVEGLVARGALYANKGSYDKAITDFELALKERPNHANATNYMSETLVAYAKQFEDEKNLDMAIQYYKKCLTVNPNHKEAQASLQVLMKRGHRPNFNIDFMEMENGKPKGDATVEGDDDRKSRRRKKESKKKRSGSSSSDSGSSSSSRFSSSGSDGSSRGRSKKRKSKKSKREASLSPFSKKQAQATLNPTSAPGANAGPALPPSMAGAYPSTEYPSIATRPHPVPPPYDRSFMAGNPPPPAFAGYGGVPAPTGVGYDKEVQSFIQRTALNEEYEKKVELFLQRVGTGKDGPKEKESEKEKDKKKKKKKDRSKDKKKSSKREKSKKDKKKKKRGSDDEDSDKIMSPQLSGLDELGELEAKLSAVYNKLAAKDSSKKKKKRKRHSSNSSNSSSSSGSSSDSDLERKKRKAKKALEDLAAAAALLRGGSEVVSKTGSSITPTKPEPVPPPSYGGASSSARMEDEDDDYGGKWRPMALKVNLGRASDEPQVEESRMVYMREERKSHQASQKAPVEPEDDLPPGEDRVSFKINSFGTFGPGNRQGMQKQASPPKPPADDSKHEEKGRDGSRSRSRSRGRGSRSRSRSRSGSRSYSRSRSRSGSRDRRRRTRSRSHSGDRRHARGYRGGNNHRYQNNNNNYHNNRGGRYIQRGGFQHRGRGWNNNNYNNNNRGGYNNRPYNNRPYHNNNNNQGYDNRRRFDNNRGRNRGGYWEQRMQRSYSRSRSRSRSRSYTRSRSRSRSVTRSRSRSRENRGDRRETSPRQDQQQQQGGNNDRRTPDRRQSSPPPRKNEPSTPTQSAPPPPMPTLSASAERRRMGGKWDDRADEEEDLVPPGCE